MLTHGPPHFLDPVVKQECVELLHDNLALMARSWVVDSRLVDLAGINKFKLVDTMDYFTGFVEAHPSVLN
jgi:hypothetical protein